MKKSVVVILIIILLTIPPYFVFSESASSLTEKDSMNFMEVLKDAEGTSSYREAFESYEKSLLELEMYSYPGDAGLSLTPGVKTQWTDFTNPAQTELDLNVGVSFFLGRSPSLEDKFQAAGRNVEISRLDMVSTLNEAVVTLYNLYSNLWLLQQEEVILEKEKQLAEELYYGTFQMYEGGSATLNDLEDSDEELQLAEDELNQNFLKQRLTWYTLQQARGKSENFQNVEIPNFEEYWFEISEMPKPAILFEKILFENPDLLKMENSIVSLNDTIERLKGLDMDIVLRPFLGYDDYSMNLNWAWENRSMNLNFDLPLANFNMTGTEDSQKKWNGGLSLVLNIGTGKENTTERMVLESEIRRQKIVLQDQVDKFALTLRSAYQQFIQAQQSLDISETALARQIRLKNAVYTRYNAGLALKTELLSADLGVERSQWKIAGARVELQRTFMVLAVLSGVLPDF
ncbi:MAG: TolC family protein [Spirochaetales bacterium]|nr:TolC family protein [Spirochaetales bacterium]